MKASARWGALALLAFVVACDDSAGPESPEAFDARSTVDDYAAIEGVLNAADWQSLGLLAKAAPAGGPARVGAMGGPAAAPIISDTNRGKTFVYDDVAEDWVVDPDREGAPSNGVRFIVYDEVAGVPDPSRERGFADLIDEGDDSESDIVLRLRVTEGGTVTLDYGLTADHNETRAFVEATGFVSGNGETLDFDIQLEGRDVGPHEITFDLGIDQRSVFVSGRLAGRDDSDDGVIELMAEHRDHRFDVDFVSEAGTVSGGIDLNRNPFVVVSGPSSDPEFTRPDGSALRPIEILALLRIVDVAEDVFDLIEDVIDPVDEIVLLGLVL